jgi:hypothetical protein
LLAILGSIMLKRETILIADIYVPIKRRALGGLQPVQTLYNYKALAIRPYSDR